MTDTDTDAAHRQAVADYEAAREAKADRYRNYEWKDVDGWAPNRAQAAAVRPGRFGADRVLIWTTDAENRRWVGQVGAQLLPPIPESDDPRPFVEAYCRAIGVGPR